MKDRRGNTIRLNEGIDPNMLGIEVADAKHGRHVAPRRLRYLRRDLETADSIGTIAKRIAIRMSRRIRPAA